MIKAKRRTGGYIKHFIRAYRLEDALIKVIEHHIDDDIIEYSGIDLDDIDLKQRKFIFK